MLCGAGVGWGPGPYLEQSMVLGMLCALAV